MAAFNMTKFLSIMFFYMILSYIIAPVIFYFLFGKTALAAGRGFVVGSIISILLWHFVGYKMV